MNTRLLFATSLAELLDGDADRVEATIQSLREHRSGSEHLPEKILAAFRVFTKMSNASADHQKRLRSGNFGETYSMVLVMLQRQLR